MIKKMLLETTRFYKKASIRKLSKNKEEFKIINNEINYKCEKYEEIKEDLVEGKLLLKR